MNKQISPANSNLNNTNLLRFGNNQVLGKKPQQFEKNTHFTGATDGNTTNMPFGGQFGGNTANHCPGQVSNMQNFVSFQQDYPIQNQCFNMSAQLKNFQRDTITDPNQSVGENPNKKVALGVVSNNTQHIQQSKPVHGLVGNQSHGVNPSFMPRHIENKVQDIQMRNLMSPKNMQPINRPMLIDSAQSNSLGLLTVPKPKAFQKIEQQKSEDEKKKEAEKNESKTGHRYGESPLEQIFIFTGTAERVIKWAKLFEKRFCLFEVMSSVVQLAEGRVRFEKILLLKDKKGPVLQVTYYSNSTHINIENFHFGQMLSCVGRMIGPNMLSASAIRVATPAELETLPRMCCACDRQVQYFCGLPTHF